MPEDRETYQNLLDTAFRLLSLRPRSKKELEDQLRKKLQKCRVEDENLLETVIVRLEELGYVNDGKFAEWWIKQRYGAKPKGSYSIQHELQEKGISRDLIATLLEGSVGDERQAARRLADKRIFAYRHMPKNTQKSKLCDYLARRGFSFDIIDCVVDEIIEKDYNT